MKKINLILLIILFNFSCSSQNEISLQKLIQLKGSSLDKVDGFLKARKYEFDGSKTDGNDKYYSWNCYQNNRPIAAMECYFDYYNNDSFYLISYKFTNKEEYLNYLKDLEKRCKGGIKSDLNNNGRLEKWYSDSKSDILFIAKERNYDTLNVYSIEVTTNARVIYTLEESAKRIKENSANSPKKIHEIHKFKCFNRLVRTKNEDDNKWENIDALLTISDTLTSGKRLRIFDEYSFDINLSQNSGFYTNATGNDEIDYTGLNKNGIECKVYMITFKDRTAGHMGTFAIESKGVQYWYRLEPND